MQMCGHMYACMYAHMHIYVYIYIHMYTNIHMYAHVYTHIYIYLHTHICIYTHTHTYRYWNFLNRHLKSSNRTRMQQSLAGSRTEICVGKPLRPFEGAFTRRELCSFCSGLCYRAGTPHGLKDNRPRRCGNLCMIKSTT